MPACPGRVIPDAAVHKTIRSFPVVPIIQRHLEFNRHTVSTLLNEKELYCINQFLSFSGLSI